MARPNNYRLLTAAEIRMLEAQGCRADDWRNVSVADGFTPERVEDVRFYGPIRLGAFRGTVAMKDGVERPTGIRRAELHDVTVGDDCLIEHIHGYISRYDVADRAVVSDVGTMTTEADTWFAQDRRVGILSESGGEFAVPLHRHLTAQEAYMRTRPDKFSFPQIALALRKNIRGTVGEGATVCHTRCVANAYIGPHAVVECADVVDDCFLDSTKDAPTRIGAGVICRHSILDAGAEVVDGAKVNNCFVGRAAHIGQGFTAESSLFFANCHMDNGEACALCAGPFTVSHHKGTLLIGCMTSFFNAGSGTNMSNHMYKLGPLHYGTLDRGCKTASGAHLVWDGHIGAFSMVMGRYACHADLSDFPFSYIFTRPDGKVTLVPGVNFATVGTYRDVRKWPEREKHSSSERNFISTYEELNPHTVCHLRRGREKLEALLATSPTDDCEVDRGVVVTPKALRRGVELYRRMEQLYIGRKLESEWKRMPPHSFSKDEIWHDVLGVIMPEHLEDSLQKTDSTEGFFATLCARYPDLVQEHIRAVYTPEDIRAALEAYPDNVEWYYNQLIADARKEVDFAPARGFIFRLLEESAEELKKAHMKASE